MDREIKRLQGCINDLIAIVALPTKKTGMGMGLITPHCLRRGGIDRQRQRRLH